MRTSSLQDLYLQRPITMVVLICMLSVLPWIGISDFATKGEPREAAVAISMLETGNIILPYSYADEFAYKPPMAHWLMAAFSYPQGYVSEFTSRLPSALAFIVMIAFVLGFFGKRVDKFREAFIAACILITCIEVHRAALTTRVDMLLTLFIVVGLIQLFRWEERQELKGLPVVIPILLGCAVLTKGPVGIILPLFVFGVYLLLLNKYRIFTIIKSLFYIGISSLFLPSIWYVAAWKQGGDNFLNVILAENIGRFFHIRTINIQYELGHERNVWFNFITLIAGFVPWTLLAFFSLFGMKLRKPDKSLKAILNDCWTRIRSMEKVRLFSLVAIVCILFFYSIPSSKRSVYLMPAYPFISLFIAQFFLYLTEYKTKVTRVFAFFMAIITSIVLIVVLMTMTGIIDPVRLVSQYITNDSALYTISSITGLFTSPDWLTLLILTILCLGLGVVYYQLAHKINIKILYSTIGLMFCINILVDGVIMRGEKNSNSARPFAERIKAEYPLTKENVYVFNNLLEHRNMYALNFYMGNSFHDFEDKQPESGYFLSSDDDFVKAQKEYTNYTFTPLTTTERVMKDVRRKVVLSRFVKSN